MEVAQAAYQKVCCEDKSYENVTLAMRQKFNMHVSAEISGFKNICRQRLETTKSLQLQRCQKTAVILMPMHNKVGILLDYGQLYSR